MADARTKATVRWEPTIRDQEHKHPKPREVVTGAITVHPDPTGVPWRNHPGYAGPSVAPSGLATGTRKELHLQMVQTGGVAYWGPSGVRIGEGYPISETSTSPTVITTKSDIWLVADQAASGNIVAWAEFPNY